METFPAYLARVRFFLGTEAIDVLQWKQNITVCEKFRVFYTIPKLYI